MLLNVFRHKFTFLTAVMLGFLVATWAALPAHAAWQQDEAEWLIMLYMNAEDKTLEESLLSDLQEAELVGSSEDLHIVAQVDRYDGGFEGNADFTTAKRFYVTQDSDTEVLNSTEVADLGEINMADAGPLQDFIEWAVESYPARNTMLIFSGHGAGWPGGFIDPAPGGKGPDEVFVADLFGTDGLWLMELDRALADSRAATGIEKFDIVGFDSCLMSQIEVHSTMAKHAEYAIASEGLEPGIGWAYSSFLGDLSADPQMPADELSRRVVDSYINEDMLLKDGVYAAALGLDVEKLRQTMMHNMTLSAVDLNKMTALIDALDQLAAALVDVDQDIVAQARTYAQSFESPFGRQAGSPYIDLGHFAQWIEENAAGTRAAESAVVVRAALDEAVISERKGPGRPGATGISIFFPGPKVYATAKNYGYDQIAADFVSSSAWDEYLSTHYETGQRQNFRPARSRTTQDLAEELNLSPNATKALLSSIGSRSEEFRASRERVLEILSEKLGVEAEDADGIYAAIQDLIRDVTDEAEVRQILQDEGGFPEDLIDFLSAVGALTPLDDAETVVDLQSVLQQSLGFDAADAEEVAGLVELLVSEGFSQAEIQSILVEEVGFTQEVVDYLTAINALVVDPRDARIQSAESQIPLFIDPLELSDELVSVVRNDIADDVLVVSTVVEGQDLAYIGYKVGRFLPREGTIIWEEQNLLMPDDVRYVGGIPYPEWDGNSVELDFEWIPWLPAISDGEWTVRTLLIPDGLDVDAGIITYMAEGIYRFADDGEERYAQLFFRDDVLTQVFGFAGAEQSGVGAPWEILPRPGDQFTVFDQTSDLEEERRLGGTLTFGDSPLTMDWVEAPSGNYVIGVYAENLSGGYVEEFQSVFVVNEDSESNDGWTPYINRELGFALLYPDDPDVDQWSITEEDASVQFETDTMVVTMLVDTFPEATSETAANVAARAEAIRLLQDLDLTDLLIDDPFPDDGKIDF